MKLYHQLGRTSESLIHFFFTIILLEKHKNTEYKLEWWRNEHNYLENDENHFQVNWINQNKNLLKIQHNIQHSFNLHYVLGLSVSTS